MSLLENYFNENAYLPSISQRPTTSVKRSTGEENMEAQFQVCSHLPYSDKAPIKPVLNGHYFRKYSLDHHVHNERCSCKKKKSKMLESDEELNYVN